MEEEHMPQEQMPQEQMPQGQKSSKGPMKPALVAICVICGTIMFLGFWYILFSQFFGNLFGVMNSVNTQAYNEVAIQGDKIDVFYVEGTIASDSATYAHSWTLNQIDELMENENNKGILLYIIYLP